MATQTVGRLCWNKGVCPIWKLPPGNTEWKQKREGINYSISSSQPIKNKTKKSGLGEVNGVLPLTLQKAEFSAWQNLSRAQFHLCVDSSACCLTQPEHNFQAPGQSRAPAASHLEKLWDADSNSTVLPWASNQLPFRPAKAQFSCSYYILLITESIKYN